MDWLKLVVWSLSFQLYQGGPVVTEDMVAPLGDGCGTFCNAYVDRAADWARRNGLKPHQNCVCVYARECVNANCVNEPLQREVP
jgi:hypothetical protein